jgi:16S rRNA (guanine966-N2)-methyltransferase
LGQKALASLVAGGWLVPDGIVVLEEAAGTDVGPQPELRVLDQRTYGDTQVLFFQFAS